MGADGGICWIRITDRKAYEELTGWFNWRYVNTSAYAYGGQFAGPVPPPPGGPDDWLEGGYGTDCEFAYEDLRHVIDWLASEEKSYDPPFWEGWDIRDYTFDDLKLATQTDPEIDRNKGGRRGLPYHSQLRALGAVYDAVYDHLYWKGPDVPEHLRGMALREWGKRLSKIIVGQVVYVETWT
jgi:hypothetical protein